MMSNPNNFPVEFDWELENAVFIVAPTRGILQPHSAMEAVVTWQPTFGTASKSKGKHGQSDARSGSQTLDPSAEAVAVDAALQAQTTACMDLRLKGRSALHIHSNLVASFQQITILNFVAVWSVCEDSHLHLMLSFFCTTGCSESRRIMLRGELPAGTLKFKEKEVCLGPVPQGELQAAVVQLKNTGSADAAFRVCTASHKLSSKQSLQTTVHATGIFLNQWLSSGT
jgi:hypothetical protein